MRSTRRSTSSWCSSASAAAAWASVLTENGWRTRSTPQRGSPRSRARSPRAARRGRRPWRRCAAAPGWGGARSSGERLVGILEQSRTRRRPRRGSPPRAAAPTPRTRRSPSTGSAVAVGLFGLQTITMRVAAVTSRAIASRSWRPSSSSGTVDRRARPSSPPGAGTSRTTATRTRSRRRARASPRRRPAGSRRSRCRARCRTPAPRCGRRSGWRSFEAARVRVAVEVAQLRLHRLQHGGVRRPRRLVGGELDQLAVELVGGRRRVDRDREHAPGELEAHCAPWRSLTERHGLAQIDVLRLDVVPAGSSAASAGSPAAASPAPGSRARTAAAPS